MSIEQHLFYTKRPTPWLLEIDLLKQKLSEAACLEETLVKDTLSKRYFCQETSCNPFLEWQKISFNELENLEIEGRCIKVFYKSFFVALRAPEILLRSFWLLLTSAVPEEVIN